MKNNNNYIFGITLVATLGGLLFGYDTAVISGAVESLRKFFIDPLGLQPDQANALEGFVVSSALIGCIIGASILIGIAQVERKSDRKRWDIRFIFRTSHRNKREQDGCRGKETMHFHDLSFDQHFFSLIHLIKRKRGEDIANHHTDLIVA